MINLTLSELMDLISLCKCDIRQNERLIENIDPRDTDFIDAIQEQITEYTELLKKLEIEVKELRRRPVLIIGAGERG